MEKLKYWGDFLSGYASGLVSCTVCAPLDLTRTRLNLTKTTNHPVSGFLKTFIDIFKKKGVRGYYDGNIINF
jgi:Mitochondrial carrier protein